MQTTIGTECTRLMPFRSQQSKATGKVTAALILFLGSVLLATAFVSFGRLGWPGLHWDASLYGTPVLHVARGEGWRFSSHAAAIISRPDSRYSWHGMLHVIVYGLLGRANSWDRFLFESGLINALTFSVYTALYALLLSRRRSFDTASSIGALLLGSIAGVLCLGLQGRPEQLAPLILAMPLITLNLGARPITTALASGTCLGLLLLLSPLIGMVYAVVHGGLLYVLTKGELRRFTPNLIASTSLAACVTLSLILLTTPYTPAEWVVNIRNAGQGVMNLNGVFVKPLFWAGGSLVAPAWNLLSIYMLIIGLLAILKRGQARLLIAVATVVAWTYLNQKMVDYSYAPLIPFSIALAWMAPAKSWLPGAPTAWSERLFPVACFALSGLYLAILLFYLTASLTLPFEQISLAGARTSFLTSVAGRNLNNPKIAIGYPSTRWPSLVVFSPPSDNYASLYPRREPGWDNVLIPYQNKTGRNVDYLVYSQARGGSDPCPPEKVYMGNIEYKLAENHWQCPTPSPLDRITGPLHLTNRYNYAIYRSNRLPS